MSKKQNGKKIRLEYHYDRLSNRKIAQVYKILVPNDNTEKGGNLNEDNGHLCTGIVKQTKRGKNHR
jgi:hypothetical protein